ncbi:Carbonic anhydrase, beta class [hydrothermal vent metagenome]|uniref:carbonic anhydrase n=1 Tax=hydrothermal vent metagenome TaxID=652676 RepID=A0A3B0YI98_9ZZZZ
MPENITADEALQRLIEGNRQFVTNRNLPPSSLSQALREELVEGQMPFAIILGCSDSRVPAEIVFGQGLGDLFVIRVAGNIVAPSQIGSVEFAVSLFHTRLVVVLGHSHCGAITATLDALHGEDLSISKNIHAIVNRIKPTVEGLLRTNLINDKSALEHEAMRANVRASANQLRHGSEIIERMVEEENLMVVGAEYLLETGVVNFFDGV